MMETIKKLQDINWDFSDYNSTRYPYDLNSIPWYPATFVPPIPKFLIASLTNPGDIVFDPFGGSGTTTIEALKQNRRSIYNDLNPFASDIIRSLIAAIGYANEKHQYLDKKLESKRIDSFALTAEEVDNFIKNNGINRDVYDWYQDETLKELIGIINLIENDCPEGFGYFVTHIRRLAFSSILKSASSQPGHFTYITDNCKPTKKTYRNAINMFLEKEEQICLAAEDFLIQFYLTNPQADIKDLIEKTIINNGDARNLEWIKDNSVDLVLTSPPYLCSQDYIKTMRLTNLFFPNNEAFDSVCKKEIGARSSRRGKSDVVVPSFYNDMKVVFSNINRVLKPNGYFCLVIGQGKARIASSYNIIADLCLMIEKDYNLKKVFRQNRSIGNRTIRIGGVDNEDIIIFQKTKA